MKDFPRFPAAPVAHFLLPYYSQVGRLNLSFQNKCSTKPSNHTERLCVMSERSEVKKKLKLKKRRREKKREALQVENILHGS